MSDKAAPPNWREYLKLEDQMATLKPMEALGACMSIAAMICGSIGITEEQFVGLVRQTFAQTAGEMRVGEHWLIQSRRRDPGGLH